MNILLFGPQGSGKGTQANRIAEEYGLAHVATGDIIRAMKEEDSDLGRELKSVYDRGDLVSDELMIRLIQDRLGKEDARAGSILDGFPRTMPQAEALDELLERLGRGLDVIFEFQVNDRDLLLERILKRAREEGRSDDTPEAIERRLQLYYEQTEPLIRRYLPTGKVVGIHAEGTIDEVYSEIQRALEQVEARA